jgi:hypothetical protein
MGFVLNRLADRGNKVEQRDKIARQRGFLLAIFRIFYPGPKG